MKASFIATLVGATAVAAAGCPAPHTIDSQGRYSCIPGRAYPEPQACADIDGCPYLIGLDAEPIYMTPLNVTQPTETTGACPAAGSTDSEGRYSCNPAHQYPNGQTCGELDGCLILFGSDGQPVIESSAEPTQTGAACPAAGSTDSKGRYSCNPAHQYPNGQTCGEVDGCLFLLGPDGKPVINSPAQPTQTGAACPAPGSTDSQGRYSCNPAHQYPNGQSCVASQGCYFLCGSDGKPVDNAPAPTETAAAACPAPGSTDSQGRYSCNPAHQYPNGQSCVAFQGCYFLCGSDGKPVDNGPAPATGAVQPPQPSGAACPAPGSTDSQGRYSCNPAHQYPNGQTCVVVDGCYVLTAGDKPVDNNNGTTPALPPVTAGASSMQAAGALVLAAFGLLL